MRGFGSGAQAGLHRRLRGLRVCAAARRGSRRRCVAVLRGARGFTLGWTPVPIRLCAVEASAQRLNCETNVTSAKGSGRPIRRGMKRHRPLQSQFFQHSIDSVSRQQSKACRPGMHPPTARYSHAAKGPSCCQMVNRAGLSPIASQPWCHYALLLAIEAADGAPLKPAAAPAAAAPAACASCSTSSASAASSTGLPRAGSAAPSVSATTARYGRPCVDRRTVAGWEARPCLQPSGRTSSCSGGRNSGEKPQPWSMQRQCFGALWRRR